MHELSDKPQHQRTKLALSQNFYSEVFCRVPFYQKMKILNESLRENPTFILRYDLWTTSGVSLGGWN